MQFYSASKIFFSHRGVHPPETMMHFLPCFRFPPLFSKNCKILWKISNILPFLDKISDFHPPKFLMTFFLVIDHKFRIFPISVHFPPDWQKFLFRPYFHKFPPLFSGNSPAFYILSVYFTPLL